MSALLPTSRAKFPLSFVFGLAMLGMPTVTSASHVKYLTWYTDVALDAMPTATHANLQMHGNLTVLLQAHTKFGLPGAFFFT